MFESKTIMKMELLVLPALEWKMYPVTPISFIDYIMRRFRLVTHCRHSELVRRCERVVLAVLMFCFTSSRFIFVSVAFFGFGIYWLGFYEISGF